MMDNVFVRSPDAVTPVLQGVTFSVSPGTIAVITGPVGSGKSTLLRTILGETTVDLGSVMVSKSSVGFCSQSPWLPSTSIRNAICDPFDLEVDVDQDWYCKVIEACDLRLDLSRLTRGDETVIGTGGTLLSGGQKQRIALARALYTRSKILVLDDVLSALDNKTRLNVVENLLGESGLCRKLNMTVILASHAVEVHRFADKILGLADGRIEHEGSHSQLVRAGVLQKFEQTVASAVDSDAEDTAKAINIQNDSSKAAEANEKDDLKRRVGDRAVYSYYFKSIGWKKSMLFLGFASGHVFATTFSQIWLKWWVDGGNYKTSLFTSIYVLLAVVNAAGICGYASAMLITITPSVARKLHYVLLRTIMRAPRSFFDTASAGDILNRFSQDMSLIETQLATGALVTITNILGAAAEVALIATGSAYMAVTIPLLIITVYFLQNVYLRTSRQLRLLDLETRGPLFSLFVETLEGLSTIRAFDWQSSAVKRCRYLLDESQKPFYLLLCVQSWLNLVLDLIVAAESVIVVSLAITLRTHTNAAFLGVSLNNILVFNASLASVIQGWTLLETSLGSIARLRTLERNVQPEEQPSESTPPPMHWPSGGSITLSNLTASYNDTSPAIADINLEIQPGQKIGVCGRTGSGKSSLIAMMARLVEISAGSMTIDGMDASSIPRDKLREKLAFIPQDAPILVGSLRFNVDPANTKDDSDIIRALDRVGLWSSLADRGGLELQLTPTSLSHGQRQLLSLARAILKNTKILLLDEPTSHIDAEQEAKLQDVLREEFADCTTITVAHRMNTIYPASDMIVVMEEGRIVEAGRPENLLRLDGKFAQLLRVTEG